MPLGHDNKYLVHVLLMIYLGLEVLSRRVLWGLWYLLQICLDHLG